MCGIIGYIGGRDIVPVLTEGLKKLEYRGYDSAGIAFACGGGLSVHKKQGKVQALCDMLGDTMQTDTVGIGHTRWATHGKPSDLNSHPHTDDNGNIAVVHNGIIENYMKLREWLASKGIYCKTETDTEVVAHIVNYYYEGDLRLAVQKAVTMLEGSYAIGVISANEPEKLVCAKKNNPLVVGIGEGENFIASDFPAIIEYTKNSYILDNGEIAELTKDNVRIFDEFGRRVNKDVYVVDWDVSQAEKAGYEHFMIKEIFEQPKALKDTLMPRVKEGRINLLEDGISDDMLSDISKITIVACGTAAHAGYAGRVAIERLARIPVEVDIASEFRYRDPIIDDKHLVIVISQSGQTADTIEAMREAKRRGARTLAITNVVGSTVSIEADAVLHTRAGIEIAVASTKAYITQLMALYMLALEMGRLNGRLDAEEYARLLEELEKMSDKAADVLNVKERMQKLASERFNEHSIFFIGRGIDYALAMEASLKLKEISYIHSEAYAAGELKHGTIALIEKDTLVIALATQSKLVEKTVSNIEEVRARGAYVVSVCDANEDRVTKVSDMTVELPACEELYAPILAVIPMQLFAYYVSLAKGFDVDKPRNLAKTVTVE